jgi:hypothetical protein
MVVGEDEQDIGRALGRRGGAGRGGRRGESGE